MRCPDCGEEFGVAYLYKDKDKPHTEQIECPGCHKKWENPELNHCISLDMDGKCLRNRKVKCKGELGFEKCFDYTINSEKPPLGCKPFYVYIGPRIEDLCNAVVREYESSKPNHDKVLLWCKEIIYLNEMDRNLRYDEKCKVWRENKDGTLKEMK